MGSAKKVRSLLITKPSRSPAGMRQPPDAVPFCFSHKRRRDIVPIARSLLDRVGRRQALAGRVKHEAAQQTRVLCACAGCPLDPVLGENRLDLVPQWLVDDGRMLSRI